MTIEIPANDHGYIRVFATDMELPSEVTDKSPQALLDLLGADLDPTYVDIVRISDLGEMKLTDYIAEGYDMKADTVDKATVDGISGYAILILSRATGDQAVTLNLAPGISHVTTYSPTARMTPPEPLPDASAKGNLDTAPVKAPKSDARVGGMIATYALIIMFVLVGLMVWVGG
jgi:hypothetical protein